MCDAIEKKDAPSLLNEVKDFIKNHKRITLWGGKEIIISNNKISLIKRSGNNREVCEDTILEFKIKGNTIIVEVEDDDITYTELSDVQDLRNEFIKNMTSNMDTQRNKTKQTLVKFFNQN